MIILPERNSPRGRILLPQLVNEWRTPSQARVKDCFGNENRTRFSLTARLNDGRIAWRGWFDDREDADAFLFAVIVGSLCYERALWDLPTPVWRPGLGDHLSYEFVTTVFITSGATWDVPSDCSGVSGQAGEFIDTIGAGASGAASSGLADGTTGGGGGAWSQITSLSLTPGGSVDIQVGTAGTAVSANSGARTNGNTGNDTWFNGASLALSSVGAKAGVRGTSGAPTESGGAGGASASGVGTTKNSGGRGGNVGATHTSTATGGGGAAGSSGAGNNGADTTASGQSRAGGSGDAGAGGAGGASGGGAAGNGTEYDATHGSGGGGGGNYNAAGAATAGASGLYGGGGGGAVATGATANSSAGKQGLIVVAYEPVVLGGTVGGGPLIAGGKLLRSHLTHSKLIH